MRKTMIFWVIIALFFTSCDKHKSFKNSEEAIEGCKKELDILSSKTSVDTKELTKLTMQWIELRDSAYSVFAKDATMTLKNKKAFAYFVLSDSIRTKLQNLAVSQKRTLEDVMYLKINTSAEREKVTSSDEYKNAVDFYEQLDEVPTYVGIAKTLQQYNHLLNSTKKLRKETQLMSFIKEEDKCYRSLMQNLSQISQPQLQYLTDKTSNIISTLYAAVGLKKDEINERTMLYLTMRFNRRIVQNMVACREDIVNNKKLTNAQKANYRWMLIQSYMGLDSYSVAALTEKQRKTMINISKEFPTLLIKLDGGQPSTETKNILSQTLSSFFIKYHLSVVL